MTITDPQVASPRGSTGLPPEEPRFASDLPTPEQLAARYEEVRATTEALSAPLNPEDQVVQSMPDVSPTKWHRAHTTWFFETFVLAPYEPGFRPVHPSYDYLFNSYYEQVGPRHPRHERGLLSRPTVAEVGAYRATVDHTMGSFLAGSARERWDEVAPIIEIGLHHEQQHQELLLVDIKHVLSRNPLCPSYQVRVPAGPASSSWSPAGPVRWCEVEGGVAELGHAGRGFAWDNEGPRHRVFLDDFAVADRLVTCGEWEAFIRDGGYTRPELWLSEGWAMVQQEGWEAPLYWERDGHGWALFTLHGRQPLVTDEPVVHVSFLEADAYARWSGFRLPTEAEWEVAATRVAAGEPPNDLSTGALHPRAAPPVAGERDGVRQLAGDVWEWTASAYRPYPGFRNPPGAVGEYNGKFMCSQMVLRGGACVTPAAHVRPTYRNFFPPSARWAAAGLRLAADPA